MKDVSLRRLRIFNEVARQLSFVRAAEALHLTPPAVTMQIKELEAAAGLPLFDRSGRKVALTTAGEYLLVYVRRILANLKDAEDMMARLKGVAAGALNVGLVSTAKYFLPRLLARFREEHPGIEVRLQVCTNREQLVALLRDKEIELAVMGRPPKEFATRAEAFAAHPHVFVAPPGHELLQGDSVEAGELENYPFIVREPGSGTRKHMQDFFDTHHIAPTAAMEMHSNESIKQAVMAGMGLSFLSLHTIGLEAQNDLIKVLPVEGTPIVRTWNLVHLPGQVLPPAAEALRYFILENVEPELATLDQAILG
jgi:DNA-binding transcriptional LysR family regulator